MGELDELRCRVESAEQHFGLIKEEQSKYSQRLLGVIDSLEIELGSLRSEQNAQETEVARLNFQNEELRSMLHSLLRSIESENFGNTLRELDNRILALIEADATPSATEQMKQVPVEAFSEEEPMPAPIEAVEQLAESAAVDTPGEAPFAAATSGSLEVEESDFGEEGGSIEEVEISLEPLPGDVAEAVEWAEIEPATMAEMDSPQESILAVVESAETEAADDAEPVRATRLPEPEATVGSLREEETVVEGTILFTDSASPDTSNASDEASVKDILQRVSQLVRELASEDEQNAPPQVAEQHSEGALDAPTDAVPDLVDGFEDDERIAAVS